MWYATRRKGCEKTEECDKTEHSCWQLRRQEWTKILFSSYLNNFSAVGSWELLTWDHWNIAPVLQEYEISKRILKSLDWWSCPVSVTTETGDQDTLLNYQLLCQNTLHHSGLWMRLRLSRQVTARGKQTGDLLSTEYDLCYEIMNWNYKIHDMLET